MDFSKQRRQPFLSEAHYKDQLPRFEDVIYADDGLEAGLRARETERGLHLSLASSVGFELFNRLTLRYTAGEPIAPLRLELEQVISAYERYGQLLWAFRKDRNEVVFEFTSLDEYCQLLQLIGLCFLLHRRDLLPRVAAMQDGEDGANGGCDVIYEEFMLHVYGAERRYQTEHACQIRPYENLFYALTEQTPEKQLLELDCFLKHWYKDLAGTGWHDSHKPDEVGNQGGYYGYWSFEAGAAVILLGIEDDSSLHQYLYYPKDLVAWCRDNAALSDPQATDSIPLRCLAGQPCVRDGFWFTPASPGSQQRFTQGQVMPDLGGAFGATVWQWAEQQDAG